MVRRGCKNKRVKVGIKRSVLRGAKDNLMSSLPIVDCTVNIRRAPVSGALHISNVSKLTTAG